MPTHFDSRLYRAAFRRPLVTAHGVWAEREGIVVRLSDDTGRAALGEVAPLPAWGSETLPEAGAFLASLPSQLDEATIRAVPGALPCCRFALETAWEALHHPVAPLPVRQLPMAALLPAGAHAVAAAGRAARRGFTTVKWKVGVGSPAEELSLLPQVLAELQPDARLRLDANGAWDLPTARAWFKACEGRPIEFIEQPLAPADEAGVFALAGDYSTRIALDESVARAEDLRRWLDFGWPGLYVIKPSLAGSPRHLLHLLESYEAEAVFSSAFETAIGMRAALLVAARAENQGRALGFGSIGSLADDRLNLPDPGPTLSTKWLARLAPGPLWELSSPLSRAA